MIKSKKDKIGITEISRKIMDDTIDLNDLKNIKKGE